jgi:hypothetical protein
MPRILVKSLGVEPVTIDETCDGVIDDTQEREKLLAEFEVLKQEIRELVIFYLSDKATSKQLKEYLLNDTNVRKLMGDVTLYKEFCKESSIMIEGGKIYDSSYQ